MRQDLIDAKLAGRDAGRLELPAGLNPYAPGTLLAVTWETERLQIVSRRLISALAALACVSCSACAWKGLRCQLLDDGTCPDCKQPVP